MDGAAGAVGMTEDEKKRLPRKNKSLLKTRMQLQTRAVRPRKGQRRNCRRVRANTKNVEQCAGWLYKLGEQKLGVAGAYRKRWFSLRKERCRTLNTKRQRCLYSTGASQVASTLRVCSKYDDRYFRLP